MSHESIVNRQIKCTQNLPFEVIAVPQYNDAQLATNAENYLTEPINIKIRIQNKEEIGKHGTISVPKLPSKSGRKVRLIRSDQTIMSFDLLMEPEINKKNQKKSQKNIFHIFRPGGCLKMQSDNEDEYPYLPSSTYKINTLRSTNKSITSIAVEPNNIISEKIALRKNFPSVASTDRHFMGKCKPGGCLDPPFGEDKYSYKHITKFSSTDHPNKGEDKKEDIFVKEANKYIINSKNYNKENTPLINEKLHRTQLDEYQENSIHSLITYPTNPSHMDVWKLKNGRDIKINKRISSEDKARISVKEFSEIYFMPKKDKTKSLEKAPSENIDKNNVTAINNTNNNDYFISQDALEASSLVKSTDNTLTNRVSEVRLCTEINKKDAVKNNPVSDIDNLTRPLEIVKSMKTSSNVETSKQSDSDYNNKNIVNKDISNKATFDNNTSNSKIQIRELPVPDYVSEDVIKKESAELSYKKQINRMSVLRKDKEDVEINESINKTAVPSMKAEEGEKSVEVSHNSFTFKISEEVNLDSLKVQGEDSDPNENFVYDIVESKDIKSSNTKSGEVLSEEIKHNLLEVITQSQYKELDDTKINKSSNCTIIQSRESIRSLENNQFIRKTAEVNIALENIDTISNKNYTYNNLQVSASFETISSNQEQNHYEKSLEADNIFVENFQLQTLSDDVKNFDDIEQSETVNDLGIKSNEYYAQHINDKNSITDTVSNKNNFNLVPITITSSLDRTSQIKFNNNSTSQNKTDKINHRSFHDERKFSFREKEKETPILLESTKNEFDSKVFMEINSKTSCCGELNNKTDSEIKFETMMNQMTKNNNRISLDRAFENDDFDNKDMLEKPELNYSIQEKDGLGISTYSSVAIDFGFVCSVDKYNKLTIKTFDTSTPMHDNVQGKVSIIRSIIRINGDEIILPINFDTDLVIQIQKTKAMDKGAILVNRRNSQESLIKAVSDSGINKGCSLQETLHALFENLLPLNEIIQNLKEEANILSHQQISLKETLKSLGNQPKRLIHTFSQCGCEKK